MSSLELQSAHDHRFDRVLWSGAHRFALLAGLEPPHLEGIRNVGNAGWRQENLAARFSGARDAADKGETLFGGRIHQGELFGARAAFEPWVGRPFQGGHRITPGHLEKLAAGRQTRSVEGRRRIGGSQWRCRR